MCYKSLIQIWEVHELLSAVKTGSLSSALSAGHRKLSLRGLCFFLYELPYGLLGPTGDTFSWILWLRCTELFPDLQDWKRCLSMAAFHWVKGSRRDYLCKMAFCDATVLVLTVLISDIKDDCGYRFTLWLILFSCQ